MPAWDSPAANAALRDKHKACTDRVPVRRVRLSYLETLGPHQALLRQARRPEAPRLDRDNVKRSTVPRRISYII